MLLGSTVFSRMSASLGLARPATIASFRQLSEAEQASANNRRAASAGRELAAVGLEGQQRWRYRRRLRQMPNTPRTPQLWQCATFGNRRDIAVFAALQSWKPAPVTAPVTAPATAIVRERHGCRVLGAERRPGLGRPPPRSVSWQPHEPRHSRQLRPPWASRERPLAPAPPFKNSARRASPASVDRPPRRGGTPQ